MKERLYILVVVLFLLICLGCERSYYFQDTASTDLSNENIAGLRLNDEMTRIIMRDNTTTTEKGISLGNSITNVLQAYGENYYERMEQGAEIIGYYDRKKEWTLEFWYYDGKVVEIRLDLSSVQ
jgi:hypothetical protein